MKKSFRMLAGRANLNYKYWGLRLSRADSELIDYKGFGYLNTPYTGNITSANFTDSFVYDRGYGAEFSLSQGTWVYVDIWIGQKPGDANTNYQNTNPGIDIWYPRLFRYE